MQLIWESPYEKNSTSALLELLVNRPAFDKDAANGLNKVWPFDKGMDVLNDSAV